MMRRTWSLTVSDESDTLLHQCSDVEVVSVSIYQIPSFVSEIFHIPRVNSDKSDSTHLLDEEDHLSFSRIST